MRKRSRYRPRHVNPQALNWVLNGFLPLGTASDAVMILRTKNHGALANLCRGASDPADVQVLTHAFITTMSLAELGTGCDWVPEIEAAQAALLSMTQRGGRTGRLVFTGPELQAINLGMEVHDAQLDGCTIAQFEQAIHQAKNAIRRNPARVAA